MSETQLHRLQSSGPPPEPIRILTVSGSLRARSSNGEALGAAAALAPEGVRVTPFRGLGGLPAFNPDLDWEGATPPAAVGELRRLVADADALLISSPEYAHGVPGSLKNALDWLVSDASVVHKPVGVLNLSPRSRHAHEALGEILRTMSMTVTPLASVALPPRDGGWTSTTMAQEPELASAFRGALDALCAAVIVHRARREQGASL